MLASGRACVPETRTSVRGGRGSVCHRHHSAGLQSLAKASDVLGVLRAARTTRYPYGHHFLALNLDLRADDRALDLPDAPRRPIEHAIGPRRARIATTCDRCLPALSASQPCEAEFFAVLGHVELLIRWRSWDAQVPVGVEGGGD